MILILNQANKAIMINPPNNKALLFSSIKLLQATHLLSDVHL